MKKIAIVSIVTVADDTTDAQIAHLASTVSAQVDEPVGGYDGSGNEILIDSTGNSVTVFQDEVFDALTMAVQVGLDGAPAEVEGADEAWRLWTNAVTL